VSVEVNNESGMDVDEASLQAIALHAMAQIRVHPDAELAVVLVDEPAMEQLHIQWMDEPGPTDVVMRSPLKESSAISCCVPVSQWLKPSKRAILC
jgi:ssRNA-specific RNase YbeY (16S rRNA maturation enzyme)